MDKTLVRNALQGMIRATDDDSTPIIRRLARVQARAALANLDAEAASGAGERERALEEVKHAFNEAFNEHGASGYGRDTPTQKKVTEVLAALEKTVLAALASLPPATDPAMVTVPREDWDTAYRAFVGAFDTPLARRRHDDEYAADARRRLRDLDEALAAAPTIPATGADVRVGETLAERDRRIYAQGRKDACEEYGLDAGKVGTIPATGHAATEGEGA